MRKIHLVFLFILSFSFVHGQSGTLDNTFGTGGKYYLAGYDIWFNKTQLLNDGRVLLVGTTVTNNYNSSDFFIARLKQNGVLDSTFNGTGILKYSNAGKDLAYCAALQSDGKLIVGSHYELDTLIGEYKIILVRFNIDGTIDNTFGTSGKVITKLPSSNDYANSMQILSDGKIVVLSANDDDEFRVFKFNSNGSPDASFGVNGVYRSDFSDNANPNDNSYESRSILVQSDNKIVICGEGRESFKSRAIYIRLKPNGTEDSSFGKNGKIYLGDQYGFTTNKPLYFSSVVNASNEIYSIIYSYANTQGILKIGSNGKIDTTWGTKGIYYLSFTNHKFTDIQAQSDGKLVIAGQLNVGSKNPAYIARLIVSGNPRFDSTFSNDGFDTFTINSLSGDVKSIALQGNNKIVLGVELAQTSPAMKIIGVARYNATNNVGVINLSNPKLLKIAPNPVDVFSTLEFTLEKRSEQLKVELFSISGNRIATLIPEKNYDSGNHKINLQLPENLQRGNYIVFLNAASGGASIQITY